MADQVPSTTTPTVTVTATPLKPRPSAIPTFQPKLYVTLKKTVGRTTAGADIAVAERFTGAARIVDLTPYLGEGGSVTVSKSVREPAGMFSITVTDQELTTLLDSAYGLVEPMDVIEIGMARDTSLYAGQYASGMPPMMRGFVSDVRRSVAMGPVGPMRAVTIAGQDYGKILSLIRPLYLPGIDPSADLLTTFGLFDNYGVSPQEQDASLFIQQVMDLVVNQGGVKTGFIQTLMGKSQSSPVQFILTDLQPSGGLISPIGTQAWRGGTIFDLFKAFGDVNPWRELYIEDRDDGPYLVYRQTPFKDLSGAYIQTEPPTPPARVLVTEDLIVSMDVGRTDRNVANYFNVTMDRYQLTDPTWMQVYALNSTPSPYVSDYPNNDPGLYGVRVMEADSEQGLEPGGLPQDQYQAAIASGQDILSDRRTSLIAMNRDNCVLEDGQAQVRGNEALKAGSYVRMQRGQVISEFYCPSVVHQFNVLRGYTTQLTLERGTGFVDRLQASTSPYLSELDLGGVYAQAG